MRTTEPSASVVCATKLPSAGGLDLVMVRSVPPVFLIVKLIVLLTPRPTVPKSFRSGVITICGGAPAVPVSGMFSLPPLLLTTRVLADMPAAVGAYVVVAVTDAPPASVKPLAGTPGAENRGGAAPGAGEVRGL